MAEATGARLGASVAEGRLTPGCLGAILARCCRCTQTAACRGWLDRTGAGPSPPPDFCLVRLPLQVLAGGGQVQAEGGRCAAFAGTEAAETERHTPRPPNPFTASAARPAVRNAPACGAAQPVAGPAV